MKWVNHHRDYYSKDGFVPKGTPFELPDGEAPPHLSVDETGKMYQRPGGPPPTEIPPTVAAPGPTTMSEAGLKTKKSAADR